MHQAVVSFYLLWQKAGAFGRAPSWNMCELVIVVNVSFLEAEGLFWFLTSVSMLTKAIYWLDRQKMKLTSSAKQLLPYGVPTAS